MRVPRSGDPIRRLARDNRWVRVSLALPLLALAALLAFALVPSAHATTYYVAPHGSDAAAGTSPASAWRTVDRVSRASLVPGDRVLFDGGARYDGTLLARSSGTVGSPIVYGAYGTGRPAIAATGGAVWLGPGASHVRFEGLDLSSAGGATSVLAGAGEGSGNDDVTVSRCVLHGTDGSGVIAPLASDDGWTVADSTIADTGDSGIIFLGAHFRVVRTHILRTGTSRAIAYGKHGIYAKGPYAVVRDDVISGFHDDGVSLRFRSDTVAGNTISGGPIGVAFFADEPTGGTTTIANNHISAAVSGIYVSASDEFATHESFSVTGNTIASTGDNAMDIEHTFGSVAVRGNTARGTFHVALTLVRPDGRLDESANSWRSPALPTLLVAGRVYSTVADLHSATGLGAGDTLGR